MYKIFICLRYLRARLITYLATLLVAVGVMVLVVVLSVMGGFQKQFKQRVRGTLSHLTLFRRGSTAPYEKVEAELLRMAHVRAVAPRMRGLVIVGSQENYAGAEIFGIDIEKEYRVGELRQYLLTGIRFQRLELVDLFKARNFEMSIDLAGVKETARGRYLFLDMEYSGAYATIARSADESPDLPRARRRWVRLVRRKEGGRLAIGEERSWLQAPGDLASPDDECKAFVRDLEEAYLSRDADRVIQFYDEEEFNKTGLDLDHPFAPPPGVIPDEKFRPILVGIDLYRRLGLDLRPDIGLTTGYVDEKGEVQAHKILFTVVGAFKSGMVEWDERTIYARLEDLMDVPGREGFLRKTEVDEVSVALDDYEHAEEVKEAAAKEMRGWVAFTWEEQRGALLRAVELEKLVMGIILSMIVLLAVVTIMVVLILLVHEKTKDIGILRALGASRWGVTQVILTNGFVIGLVGSVVGVAIGVAFVLNINEVENKIYDWFGFRVYPREVYYLDKIPDEVDPSDIVTIVVVTLGLCLLLGAYPALLAAWLDPVEAFRRE